MVPEAQSIEELQPFSTPRITRFCGALAFSRWHHAIRVNPLGKVGRKGGDEVWLA